MTKKHIVVAEPSWKGHSLVFAANIANAIQQTGRHVVLCVPMATDENRRQVDVARALVHDEIDFQVNLRPFSSGFGGVFSKDAEIVTDSILEVYEQGDPERLVLPTADAMVSMKTRSVQAAKLRACRPCSVVHLPRLGYGGFGPRFAAGRELVRMRMRRCGHRMLTMDPLTHQSGIRSGLDMGLLSFPSPKRTELDQNGARDMLGIPRDARVLGLLGEHSKRKGTLEVLQAWPEKTGGGMVLLIMGSLSDSIQRELTRRQDQISKRQIIVHEGFISNEMFQAGFVASDVIATLYPRHHGISGISMEAAMYRTPILGGDYGANGLTIRENGLGETIDARDPSKLRKALIKVIEQDPVVDSKRRERLLSEQHPDRISESMNPWIDLENDV